MLPLSMAAADTAIALWLLAAARKARHPQPAQVTGLVLLLCAAVLLYVQVDHDEPVAPPPSSPAPAQTGDGGAAI